MLRAWMIAVLLTLGCALIASAQIVVPGVPTSSEETITVSTTAIGITADLCGPNNANGALLFVVTNGLYMSLNGRTVTPDSSDFALNAGDWFFVRPARMARFIRQSADTNLKVQCLE